MEGVNELSAYATLLKTRTDGPFATFDDDAKSGIEARRQYDAPDFYSGFSEYEIKRYGKTITDLKTTNTPESLEKMDWILSELNTVGTTYLKTYANLGDDQAAFDTLVGSDGVNYSKTSPTSTKYVIGAWLAAADFDLRSGMPSDLVASGYRTADHLAHFLNVATLD